MKISPQKCLAIGAVMLWLASCNQLENNDVFRGAVVLTFDDASVADWYAVDSVLQKYNWRATFCICCINAISDDFITKLYILQSRGHEIAAHGLEHIDAVNFLSTHTIQEYLDTDIVPFLQIMRNRGFIINSFAYPDGSRNDSLDQAMLKHFCILRGITFADRAKTLNDQECFVRGKKIVLGLMMDMPLGIDDDYLLSLLDYAHQYNDTLVLVSHIPQDIAYSDTVSTLITAYSTLEKICRRVVDNKMRFLTLADLAS